MNHKTEKPSATGTAEGFENQIENLQADPTTIQSILANNFALFDLNHHTAIAPTKRRARKGGAKV